MISDSHVSHTKYLYAHKNVAQFASDVDFFTTHFNPIQLTDLLSFIETGRTLPPQTLLLTFDDGFREMHDVVAPILLQKGIPAVFFINSSFTDNHDLCYQHKASLLVEHLHQKNLSIATKQQIQKTLPLNDIMLSDLPSAILSIKYNNRDLVDHIANILEIDFNDYLLRNRPYLTSEQVAGLVCDGFAIGAHSIDHPLYTDIEPDEQVRQTIESVAFVRGAFRLDYGAFAFPHSDHGVSRAYFSQIRESGLVDISFGTSGMIEDCVPNHFQRFSLEKPLLPAKDIFALHFAKRLWRNVKRSNEIIRR